MNPTEQPHAPPASNADRPPNFDRLAGPYRWMEWFSFGPWLAKCRFAFLPGLAETRSALVLGDGDGRFSAQLLRNVALIRVDAVDSSAAMLRALVRRAGPNASRVKPILADARTWPPTHPPATYPSGAYPSGAPYDAIVTHFFLDCLTTADVLALALRLRQIAQPHAVWIVSEFAIPPTRFGSLVAKPIIGLLYRAFGLLTGLRVRQLPDYASALRAAGWEPSRRRSFLAGLLVAESWRRTPADPSPSP